MTMLGRGRGPRGGCEGEQPRNRVNVRNQGCTLWVVVTWHGAWSAVMWRWLWLVVMWHWLWVAMRHHVSSFRARQSSGSFVGWKKAPSGDLAVGSFIPFVCVTGNLDNGCLWVDSSVTFSLKEDKIGTAHRVTERMAGVRAWERAPRFTRASWALPSTGRRRPGRDLSLHAWGCVAAQDVCLQGYCPRKVRAV